jgi:cytochrome b6-f complex iron-sulfur subunit
VENDLSPTRRQVVTAGAAGALGIAAAATLTGCGGSGSSTTTTNTGAGAGGVLAALSAVPVGGAVAAKGSDGKAIIVAQPTSGTVVAFSAICTHMGCTVAPHGATLVCPCHGSQYDAFTGKVLRGPAPLPLPSVPVKVQGSDVVPG